MRRLALVLLLLLTGCANAAEEPLASGDLAPCDWSAVSATTSILDLSSGFDCLDGSDAALPTSLPAPAIINVWGSWCPPCREEIPYFLRLANEHQVQIVGIDVDEPSMIAGQRFALRREMPWPNLLDREGASTATFGTGVPVTWFIGPDGSVVARKIGAFKSYEELEQMARENGQIAP